MLGLSAFDTARSIHEAATKNLTPANRTQRTQPPKRSPAMMTTTADAIRTVTAKVQTAISDGSRSAAIDAHDIVEILLAIADELDQWLTEAGDAITNDDN